MILSNRDLDLMRQWAPVLAEIAPLSHGLVSVELEDDAVSIWILKVDDGSELATKCVLTWADVFNSSEGYWQSKFRRAYEAVRRIAKRVATNYKRSTKGPAGGAFENRAAGSTDHTSLRQTRLRHL